MRMLYRMMWKPFASTHAAHRQTLGLAPITHRSIAEHMYAMERPFLHLLSEHVVPRPRDWPEWAHNTEASRRGRRIARRGVRIESARVKLPERSRRGSFRRVACYVL